MGAFYLSTVFTVVNAQSSANVHDVMLQGFGWDVYDQPAVKAEGGLYNYFNNRANAIAAAGFNIVWLPPPSKSTGGTGYIPTELFNFSQTVYGTEAQLKTMLSSFNNAIPKVHPMADIVVNHRGGTTNWTDFTNPTWDCKSITSNDEANWGTITGVRPCGTPDTGEDFNGGRDLDHTNSQVNLGVKEFLSRLKGLGFDSWRWDVAKGFSAQYFGDYITASAPYASVGEYWDGNITNLKNWIDGTGKKSAVFDFALYYSALDPAFNNGNYGVLSSGYPGLFGQMGYADKAVTFVDNHDTFVKPGSFTNNNNIMKAYAYILTHPGMPCVFFPHYYGGTYKKDGVTVTYTANETAINKLLAVRKANGINAYSSVVVSNSGSFYSATIDNKVVVKIGPGTWDPGTGWILNASGTDYAIWSKTAVNTAPTLSISPLGGSFVAGTTTNVTITATDDKTGTVIYYTKDGTEPTASSAVYSGPIPVSATTTIKAIAKDSDGLFSGVMTQTYTFLELGNITVRFKPPTTWGNTVYVHHWGAIPAANLSNATWPGKVMLGPDSDGYFSYTFNNIASTNLLFTKGATGPQTADINNVSQNTCYNFSTGTLVVEQCPTLSIEDSLIESTQIGVYPNPINNYFAINVDVSDVKIIDVSGKIIKQFTGDFKSNTNFDVGNLLEGVYFAKVITSKGHSSVVKLVKK